ncbi:MAG: hypothetical protein IPO21_15285 [Bacteroidales bacterium]|nr:hypothetical protein [Bacteroidales bacterium]
MEEKPLLHVNGKLNRECFDLISMILSNCMNSEKEVILVTAGAIASGIEKLTMSKSPQSLTEKQAIAAIGQVELIRRYQNVFDEYNQLIGQVLLDRNSIVNPKRRNNAQNTFNRLLELHVIPVINENDTTSTEDIEHEDNYPLAASVCEIALAHVMVVLCDDLSFNILLSNSNVVLNASDKDKLFEFLAGLNAKDIVPGVFTDSDTFDTLPVKCL